MGGERVSVIVSIVPLMFIDFMLSSGPVIVSISEHGRRTLCEGESEQENDVCVILQLMYWYLGYGNHK